MMIKHKRLEVISSSGMSEPDSKNLEKLYSWVDDIPLSRPKKNIGRDFADGVVAAELIKFYIPQLVSMHNYADANATSQKESNWYCLNKKVLCKLGLQLSPETIRGLAQCHPWVIENVLLRIRDKLDDYLAGKGKDEFDPEYFDRPEVDQRGDAYVTPTGFRRGRLSHREDDIYSPSWSEPMSEPARRHVSPSRKKAELVPAVLLIEKQRDSDVKDESIVMLNQKIKRLEHLMTLKDVKIEDLNIQIHELKLGRHNTSPNQSPSQSPRALRRSPHYSPTAQRKQQASRRVGDKFLQPEWK